MAAQDVFFVLARKKKEEAKPKRRSASSNANVAVCPAVRRQQINATDGRTVEIFACRPSPSPSPFTCALCAQSPVTVPSYLNSKFKERHWDGTTTVASHSKDKGDISKQK
jgi:hypothetical protein